MPEFVDIHSEVINFKFAGANDLDRWMKNLPNVVRGAIGAALLNHGRKMSTALHSNPPRQEGLGKYWVNRSFKLADAIKPSNVYVQDLGTSIFVHVTCDSGVYNEYGHIVLHKARRRSEDIFYSDAAGKSPVEMVLHEFKPGLVKDVSLATKAALDASIRKM